MGFFDHVISYMFHTFNLLVFMTSFFLENSQNKEKSMNE